MSKKAKFQAPTGMHDILPAEQKHFNQVYETAKNIAEFYGFRKIDTPLLENTELFTKGIGLSTDIVEKEMYTVAKRGKVSLALRPEFTAGIVRAYIEHGMAALPQPLKLYSYGPLFRGEKPQAGRYRQFHQFDLEVFGEKNPAIDAQIIQIFYNILAELKIHNLVIEVNNIGDNQCRPYYKKLLTSYLRSRQAGLCADCRRRMRLNPLRLLDCKEEKCQRIINGAPQIIDHLCQECHRHFKELLEFLDELKLPYQLNPFLVRGLDYYTKTVFEIFEQNPLETDEEPCPNKLSLAGGGRFDKLVKLLGGRDTAVCGAAMGAERIVNAVKKEAGAVRSSEIKEKSKAGQMRGAEREKPEIFLAQLGMLAKRKSLKLFELFRKASIGLIESFGRDSLKAQLNRADRLKVRYALILGQKEALDGNIIVRDMKTGTQSTVNLDKAVEEMKRRLKSK